MKKITAILLSLLLFTGLTIASPAAEEKHENVLNGGFEEFQKENTPILWKLWGTAWGTDYGVTLDTMRPYEGQYSLRMVRSGGTAYIYQEMNVLPGETYTLTYQARGNTAVSGIAHEIELYRVTEAGESELTNEIRAEINPGARWEKQTASFTPAAEETRVRISFYCYGGDYSWDAISVMGPPLQEPEPVPCDTLLEGVSGNMLTNESFEELGADGYPVNWTPRKGPDQSAEKSVWEGNPYITLDKKVAHTGTNSVKYVRSTDVTVWMRQTVEIKANTRYQVSAWVRSLTKFEGESKHVRFKVEFYTGTPGVATVNPHDEGVFTANIGPAQEGRWEQASAVFTPPEGTVIAQVYVMLYTNNTIWIDDLELVPLEEEKKLDLRPDQIFYYSDGETGYANASVYDAHMTALGNGTVDFTLYDKDHKTVLKEKKNAVLSEGTASFSYPLSLLSEKKTAYYLEAVLKNAAGETADITTKDIYVYDRPTDMNEKGELLNEDGSVFTAVLGYGTNKGDTLRVDELQALGINFPTLSAGAMAMYYGDVQKAGFPEDREEIKKNSLMQQWLDELQAKGMKGNVCLYQSMNPAAHPKNYERTKYTVMDFKDHPAVGAWVVMDEPFDMLSDPEQDLIDAYKLIRGIDDRNPVYFVDNSARIELSSGYCDIIAIDPYLSYPKAKTPKYELYPTCENNPASYPGETTAILRRTAERYGKNYMTLNHAFDYNGYYPATSELRSFWYQALFEGAQGIGWYSVGTDNGILVKAEAGDTAYKDFLEKFAKEEQGLSVELFGRNSTYPVFNIFESGHYAYKSVVKDGNLYMLVINRHAEPQEITVSLKSQNGLVTATGTPEELYLEGKSVKPVVNGDTMTLTIPAANVSLIKLSVGGTDAAALSQGAFDDLAGYDWAADAIASLYRADVLSAAGDRAYAPAENITRGDFAKYLVRALDLDVMSSRGKMAENFSDVSEDAPYYIEVRVAKSLGILRGTGDNSFNPEAPITRQDLMVICARGLREAYKASGEMADLSGFADSAQVADYAKDAVAMMNEMGIVQGNADGTLNPLGNTTRAEAAVIMQRIFGI